AKSDTKKAQIAREVYDKWMARAVAQYHVEQARVLAPKEHRKGLRQICEEVEAQYQDTTGRHIELAHATLGRLVKGGRTKAESNVAKGWLLEQEEKIVIRYALELASRGFPLDHCRLKECVDCI
ncbi:hypothetical protein DFH08DRAFT_616377, partial [Mycena albidolilacea]